MSIVSDQQNFARAETDRMFAYSFQADAGGVNRLKAQS